MEKQNIEQLYKTYRNYNVLRSISGNKKPWYTPDTEGIMAATDAAPSNTNTKMLTVENILMLMYKLRNNEMLTINLDHGDGK